MTEKDVIDMELINYVNRIKKAYTHDGIFHGDDVFAAALLKLVNSDLQIDRGHEVPEQFDGLVFDIGYGPYDHHQPDKEIRKNGVPYASFGLLWRELGAELVGEQQAMRFDQTFVQIIDETDNTGRPNLISSVISEMNPLYHSQEESDAAFAQAVEFAQVILRNKIRSMRYEQACFDKVSKLIEECEDHILFMQQVMPWKRAVHGKDITFVIYGSLRGGYNVQAVPTDMDPRKPKLPFPEEWCGVSAETLQTVSGIAGLTFCHRDGFLCATKDIASAYQVANTTLAYRQKKVRKDGCTIDL